MSNNNCNRRCKQLSFEGREFKKLSSVFGGELLGKGHARTKRPINTKSSMHITLRSSMAKYENSFLHYKNRKRIEDSIYRHGKKFNIKIYKLSINYNHLHIHARFFSVESYRKFIRSVSGTIARIVLGIKKARFIILLYFFYI